MENNNALMLPKIAFLAALILCAMVPSMAESATDSEEPLLDQKVKMATTKSDEAQVQVQQPKITVEEFYIEKPETMIKNANGKMTAAQPKVTLVKKYLVKDNEETALKCQARATYCNDIVGPFCCMGHYCVASGPFAAGVCI